jgi:hypothetical protein
MTESKVIVPLQAARVPHLVGNEKLVVALTLQDLYLNLNLDSGYAV